MTTAEQILAAADIAGQETPSSMAVNGEFPYSAIKEREILPALCKAVTGTKKILVLHPVESANSDFTSILLLVHSSECLPTFPFALMAEPGAAGKHGERSPQGRGTSHTGALPLLEGAWWKGSPKEEAEVLTSALLTSCMGMGLCSMTSAGLRFSRISTALSTSPPVETHINIFL